MRDAGCARPLSVSNASVFALPLLVLPFPAIDPVLLNLGPLHLRWYALSYVVSILIGWWYSRRLAGNQRLWGGASPVRPVDVDDFVVYATLGIILGGRIGYVLFYDLPVFLEEPWRIIAVWEGGMSFHGGFLGTVIAMLLFAWRRKLPVWSFIDTIATGIPPGIFLVRCANFINSELWGAPTDLPWGVIFPTGGEIPRHPSQLYEGFLEGIVLFLVLRFLTHRLGMLRYPGIVSGAFAIGYGVSRILLEFVRVPDEQLGYLFGPVTMGMVLSTPMVIAGVVLIAWARRRQAPQPA